MLQRFRFLSDERGTVSVDLMVGFLVTTLVLALVDTLFPKVSLLLALPFAVGVGFAVCWELGRIRCPVCGVSAATGGWVFCIRCHERGGLPRLASARCPRCGKGLCGQCARDIGI